MQLIFKEKMPVGRKTVFYVAEGGLLACKKPSIVGQNAVFRKSRGGSPSFHKKS